MQEAKQKCNHEDHSNTPAIIYCVECNKYMCKKCENNYHGKTYKEHNIYSLDKDLSTIFTGFCKEDNHTNKLEYFCKNHNRLCCSDCIVNIKTKDKGQHRECEICLLEDIKENKVSNLKDNILKLETFSNDINKILNELTNAFEIINKDKEELKNNIQKIFTKIRNTINDREDEILLSVDKLYDDIYIKEGQLKEFDKYPNKINIDLKKGKNTFENLIDDKNKLNLFINNCIEIENNLINFNQVDENLKKCKSEITTKIFFMPSEGNELNDFISFLSSFGELYKEKKINNFINNLKKFSNINNIKPKIELNNDINIDIQIKSTDVIPNAFSFELSTISPEEINKYYPNDFNYNDNMVIIQFHLNGQNDIINKIINEEKKYKDSFKISEFKLSIRNGDSEEKLIIELSKLFDEKKQNDLEALYFYKSIFHLSEISINYKNNLEFKDLSKTDFNEFINHFFSFIFSINAKFTNLDNSLLTLEKEDNGLNAKSKNELIFKITLLRILQNLNLEFNIIQDKLLEFLKINAKVNNETFNNAYKAFNSFIISDAKRILGEDILNGIDLSKIHTTLLFTKYKSGFLLDINSKGLNYYLKSIVA